MSAAPVRFATPPLAPSLDPGGAAGKGQRAQRLVAYGLTWVSSYASYYHACIGTMRAFSAYAAVWTVLAALSGCGPGPVTVLAGTASPPPARLQRSAASAASATMTPAQIAVRALPATVAIRGSNSLGAGFVVRRDGWIATNLHVIKGARELVVVLSDRTEHAVIEVLAVDDKRDLAIIRIDQESLPVLPLGESSALRAGDAVVAIGHPLGLEDTVSNGLVSAVRAVDPSLTLLQISAPIAPGSSGGPLLNDKGQVIGVAAVVSTQGQNLNFGVPATYLKELMTHADPVPFAVFAAAAPAAAGSPLPAVRRAVPHHDLSLLKGCTDGDLRLLGLAIDDAIEVGAPIYNSGNFAACYHIYEGAALDAERKLSQACKGPKEALANGRNRAATLSDAAQQAWAMRDAFDGLIDVVVRKLNGARGP